MVPGSSQRDLKAIEIKIKCMFYYNYFCLNIRPLSPDPCAILSLWLAFRSDPFYFLSLFVLLSSYA